MGEPPDPDPDHSCIFIRQVALLSIQNSKVNSMMRASDNRHQRMASNCTERVRENNLCIVDQKRLCESQCGEEFAVVIDGMLMEHRYPEKPIPWPGKKRHR